MQVVCWEHLGVAGWGSGAPNTDAAKAKGDEVVVAQLLAAQIHLLQQPHVRRRVVARASRPHRPHYALHLRSGKSMIEQTTQFLLVRLGVPGTRVCQSKINLSIQRTVARPQTFRTGMSAALVGGSICGKGGVCTSSKEGRFSGSNAMQRCASDSMPAGVHRWRGVRGRACFSVAAACAWLQLRSAHSRRPAAISHTSTPNA